MIRVLTFEGCPHADAAKVAARAAAAEAGRPIKVIEVDLLDPTIPAGLSRYPSPTVLVGSVDVSGDTKGVNGVSCRSSGAPTIGDIRNVIQSASEARPN